MMILIEMNETIISRVFSTFPIDFIHNLCVAATRTFVATGQYIINKYQLSFMVMACCHQLLLVSNVIVN